MDLNFALAVVVQFWLLKKGKSSEIDLQDTCESPRDPCHNELCMCDSKFCQQNMNINIKIYHKIHCGANGPLILRIFTF